MICFSSQRAIYYLVDSAIPVLVVNWLYKTLVMLKHQQFKNNGNDEIEPRGSKRQQLDLHDNKEEKGLNKFKDEGERKSIRYIPFPFIVPL